jgi:hypothetical protein
MEAMLWVTQGTPDAACGVNGRRATQHAYAALPVDRSTLAPMRAHP